MNGMNLCAIKECINVPSLDLEDNKWHEWIIVNALTDTKKQFQIRKVEMNDDFKNSVITGSAMAELLDYFEKIESDRDQINNTMCRKGRCDCCTSDFDVSLIEFLTILRLLNIKFGDEYIKNVSERAKASLDAHHCLFVNDSNGECVVYEVRPLICRKYGTYKDYTDCPKLENTELCEKIFDTSKNTILYQNPCTGKFNISGGAKPLVYWFANMQNGLLRGQRIRDLYDTGCKKDLSTFVKILLI